MKILYYSWDIKKNFNYPKKIAQKGYEIEITAEEEVVINAVLNKTANIIIFDTTSVLNYKKLFPVIEKNRNVAAFIAITDINNTFILEDAFQFGLDDYFLSTLTENQFIAKLVSFVNISTVSKVPQHVKLLQAKDLSLNSVTKEVKRNGVDIYLTNKEFNLLELLLKHKGKVVTRKRLIETFWSKSESTINNSPDVYITFLRRKIERKGEPRIIKTIRNIGYIIKG